MASSDTGHYNMVVRPRKLAGFSLIQLMVALAVGSVIVVGAINAFSGQTDAFRHETARDSTNKELNFMFNTVSTLLRHAQARSIVVSYGATGQRNSTNPRTLYAVDDELTLDFTLPANLPIWPNSTAPFANRAVRLTWTNAISSERKNTLMIASAPNLAGLANAPLTRISGSERDNSPHIMNFDLWPLALNGTPAARSSDAPNGGFAMQIDVRSGQVDPSYENPLDTTGVFRHYRTASASGAVNPRN